MDIVSRPDPKKGVVMDPTAMHLIESTIMTLLSELDNIGALQLPNFTNPVRHMSQTKHDALMELVASLEDLVREGKL